MTVRVTATRPTRRDHPRVFCTVAVSEFGKKAIALYKGPLDAARAAHVGPKPFNERTLLLGGKSLMVSQRATGVKRAIKDFQKACITRPSAMLYPPHRTPLSPALPLVCGALRSRAAPADSARWRQTLDATRRLVRFWTT